MALSINYNTLFEISVYHDYFLDNGIIKFSSMNEADKLKQLSRYQLASYIDIYPTKETQQILNNQRMLLMKDNSSFRVVTSTQSDQVTPLIPISDSLELKFCITIKDSYFNNYTDLSLVNNRIFLFTNKRPTTELETFPLIPVIYSGLVSAPDPDLVTNSFLATEATTTNLLKEFSTEEKAGLIGMFSIQMNVGSEKYDVLKALKLKAPSEAFGIRFQNVKRKWKYKRKKDNTSFLTIEKQPLVLNGFVELAPVDFNPAQAPVPDQYHYPNAGVQTFETATETIDGHDVGVIYSVIFI